MCVTNTTYRRSQPISLPQRQQQAVAPPQPPQREQQQQQLAAGPQSVSVSGLTQRLLSTYQLSQQISNNGLVYGSGSSSSGGPQHDVVQHQQAQALVAPELLCVAPPTKPSSSSVRPKRRRKPQKPGKTAKMNDRHFVVHNYHDHAQDPDLDDSTDDNNEYNGGRSFAQHDHNDTSSSHLQQQHRPHHRKGGVAVAFPLKLHAVLDQVEADGLGHVISWMPHGRCFVIHNPKEFTDHVMPKYFRQTKLTSFQRQLNLYGFCRLTRGPDASGYYHELFLRGKTHLCKRMTRTKVKGTKFKAASSPEQEPDFYKMPAVTVTVTATTTSALLPPLVQQQYVTPPTTSDEEEMPHISSQQATSTGQASLQLQAMNTPTSSFFLLNTCNMEPLPIRFESPSSTNSAAPPLQYSPVAAPPALPPTPSTFSWLSTTEMDQVLDQAVDEFFLQEASTSSTTTGTTGDDPLADFCQDWAVVDTTSSTNTGINSAFAESLENDKQLGYILEG